jgi:hypothetical protein
MKNEISLVNGLRQPLQRNQSWRSPVNRLSKAQPSQTRAQKAQPPAKLVLLMYCKLLLQCANHVDKPIAIQRGEKQVWKRVARDAFVSGPN